MTIDRVKDRLPDWVAGRLEATEAAGVREAVEADPELQAEAELLRSLHRSRPDVPVGLEGRILAALREDRGAGGEGNPRSGARRSDGRAAPGWEIPRWAMGVAAALVVALGTVHVAQRSPVEPADPFEVALETAPGVWQDDDGVVAGAPVFDGLSDQALSALLEEMGG